MFGVEYDKDSEDIIISSMKNIKPLLHKVLGSKSCMLKIHKEEASNTSMRKYKQVCMPHMVIAECVPYIELPGILNLDTVTSVRVQDKNGTFLSANRSL